MGNTSGQYEWTAPGVFQRLMNHYSDLRKFLGDFVLCYMDDILIGSTYKEHLEHICRILHV